MTESGDYTLRSPNGSEEWRVYHAIRRKVLFENRGRFGVYNENHPEEFQNGNNPLILFHKGAAVGVIRVDIHDRVAWFRRVAVREDLQRVGHGRMMLGLTEDFAHSRGCNEVRSNVAGDAVGFYERCGYSRDAQQLRPSDSVQMRKQLVDRNPPVAS